MKTEETVKRALLKFRDTLYFKAEEHFSDKDFMLIFLCPRCAPSKEDLIGKAIDLMMHLEIRRSNLFKAIQRELRRKLKSCNLR